jgi:hypothetical protein
MYHYGYDYYHDQSNIVLYFIHWLKLRDVLELEHWDELLTIIIIISFHYFLKMN